MHVSVTVKAAEQPGALIVPNEEAVAKAYTLLPGKKKKRKERFWLRILSISCTRVSAGAGVARVAEYKAFCLPICMRVFSFSFFLFFFVGIILCEFIIRSL